MTNDIRARLTGAQAIGRIDSATGRSRTGAAMTALAGRIAGQVADSLQLAGDGDHRHGGKGVLPGDLYEVNRQAEELAQFLAASPAEGAQLAQALHRFAEACATLIAAQPAAYALERIQAVVDARWPAGALPESAANTCLAIGQATGQIEGVRW